MSRVTILNSDVASSGSQNAMLTEEDEAMKTLILKYDHMRETYRTRKGQQLQDKPKKGWFLF